MQDKMRVLKAALDCDLRNLCERLFPENMPLPKSPGRRKNRKNTDKTSNERLRWFYKVESYDQGKANAVEAIFWKRVSEVIVNDAQENGEDAPKISDVTTMRLRRCNATELYNVLSPIQQHRVLQADEIADKIGEDPTPKLAEQKVTNIPDAPLSHEYFRRDWRLFEVSAAYRKPDIVSALETGKFDQHYLYIDIAASRRWHNLTKVPSRYPTFRSCFETLEKLLKSSEWGSLLNSKPISTIMVFGAGAAKKDVRLLDALAKRREDYSHRMPITYVLLDTSFHMLEDTAEEITQLISEESASLVIPLCIIGDFLELESIGATLQKRRVPLHVKGRRTLFWIPGNTIANVDVEKFIRSLDQISEPSDLLLIGMEFADTANLEKYWEVVEGHYDNDQVRQLVMPPVRTYLDSERARSNQSAYDLIKVRRGMRRPRSKLIPDKFTVEIHAELNEELNPTLATSSRYDRNDFLDFMKTYSDFQSITFSQKLSHDEDPQFEQVLFERK